MIKRSVGALFAALVASQAAGCIISDNTPHDVAHITATWQMRDFGSDAAQPCPVGYNSAALYALPVDVNLNPAGAPFVTFFPCDAGVGESGPLPPDVYQTWIEITNETNSGSYYARSVSANVDVVTSNKSFSADIYYDGGYFQIDWTLLGEVSRRQLACGEVPGLTDVSIEASYGDPTSSFDRQYPCEDYRAITPVLRAGVYTVVMDAIDARNLSLGQAVTLPESPILPNNQVTEFDGPVTLVIDDE